MQTSRTNLPAYSALPIDEHSGERTTWGLFDKNGLKDELGTLNLLTTNVVADAAKEIRSGIGVSLNWPLDRIHEPGFERAAFQHKKISFRDRGDKRFAYDDEVTFNTQNGSQWDGLRHWGHSKTGLHYNGVHHSDLKNNTHLGIHHWHKRGGIVGRGVLLDYVSWAEANGISFDPMSRHPVTVKDLKDIAIYQGVKFKQGDILLVRTGFVKWYETHSAEDRLKSVTNGSEWIGVEGCEETLAWLWDEHFSAIAGDTIGWEVWPPNPKYSLHDHLLSLWGMPIGELWDLEGLAVECKKQQRWSFFLTSCPLNTPGGVASPPNALAVF